MSITQPIFYIFFFNDTATTEIYTLSLHDALPICARPDRRGRARRRPRRRRNRAGQRRAGLGGDRKSTRLNSSHLVISYAVFCLKKKNHAQVEQIKDSSKLARTIVTRRKPILLLVF